MFNSMITFCKPQICAILGGLLVLTTACTTNTKPLYDSDNETDLAIQFKRYTARPAKDYIFRWNEKAFSKVQNDDFDILSEDKKLAVDRLGRPDYIREDIRAQRNENFDEWVYWYDNIILQFVSGELVYEGELLDSDRTLVEFGYPSTAYFQEYEIGPIRETWIYEKELITGGRVFSFSDGKTIFKATQ
ncbi:MAG: hypothetical protein ACFCU1_13345 [Sumerlaeia bacterium]